MKTGIATSINRAALSLLAAAAIVAGIGVSIAFDSSDADAALKWRESASVPHDNNKDGLKHVEPTPVP
jgi:hypothetical protein